MARDCTVRGGGDLNALSPSAGHAPPTMNKGSFDSEYANLMAELGESGGGGGAKSWGGASSGLSITGGGSDVYPWRRPEMWQSTTPGANQNAQSGYRPQQAYGGYGGQQAYYQGQGGGYQGYGGSGGGQDYSAAYAQYYQQQYSQQSPTPVPQ